MARGARAHGIEPASVELKLNPAVVHETRRKQAMTDTMKKKKKKKKKMKKEG